MTYFKSLVKTHLYVKAFLQQSKYIRFLMCLQSKEASGLGFNKNTLTLALD